MNLRRILEFVGLINYCDFDEQVHVGTEDGLQTGLRDHHPWV